MRAATTKLAQPVFSEPTFSEGLPTPDPTAFKTKHPSDAATYNSLGDAQKRDLVDVPASRIGAGDLLALADALGPHGAEVVQSIRSARQIVFQMLGDSGSSSDAKYKNELTVADQLAAECHAADTKNRPAFLYHLGDVVYSFGESKYYYDQFYEPFRNYPGPVFAIPGNHDSFVIPGTPNAEAPLTTFMRNFCAVQPEITKEAASLHRTAMTQPGVFFTLDAPFVRIIGLFSNALEDPGVISSQGGKWAIADIQLEYLKAQLARVKSEKFAGALLLTVHHPPFVYSPPSTKGAGGVHGSSPAMLREIDKICKGAGVYPHAVIAAHSHNYQRYTRKIRFNGSDYDVPFIVCGSGGHNVNPLTAGKKGQPAHEPKYGTDVNYLDVKPAVDSKNLCLEKYDDRNYGYLRVLVNAKELKIGFHQAGTGPIAQSRFDLVTLDLMSHAMVAN